jgi:hypothetical protein
MVFLCLPFCWLVGEKKRLWVVGSLALETALPTAVLLLYRQKEGKGS